MSRTSLFFTLFTITMLAIGGVVIYLASLTPDDWLATRQHDHPPAVNLSRDGNTIVVTWLGGYDATFVDHLYIQCGPLPGQKYYPTKVGQKVRYPLMPANTTVTVWAWDKAVQNYTRLVQRNI